MTTTTFPNPSFMRTYQNLLSTAPAHRVLFTPELLDLVLSDTNTLGGWRMMLQPRDYAACARVSRHWMSTALDFLYKGSDHDSFPRGLFQKLVPLNELSSPYDSNRIDSCSFSRSPDASDWARFEPYRLRLRYFHETNIVASSVYPELTRTCPPGRPIFPNLQELAWFHADIAHAGIFVQPTLRTVFFVMDESTLEELPRTPNLLKDLFSKLAVAATNLTSLSVMHASETDFEEVTAELPGLIIHLVNLKTVSLSPTFLTNEAMHALGTLSSLRELDGAEHQALDHADHGWQGYRGVPLLNEALRSASFPALEDLEIFQPFNTLSVLDTPFFPPKLQTLGLTSYKEEHSSTIQRLLSVLQLHAPSTLRQLMLVFPQDKIMPVWIPSSRLEADEALSALSDVNDRDPGRIMTYKTLEPLSSLSGLTRLCIIYDHYLDMSPQELEHLFMGFRRLRGLILACSPTRARRARFTLEYLVSIARCCPSLTSIRIFLDAMVVCPALEDGPGDSCGDEGDDEEGKVTMFKSLRTFDPRLSILTPESQAINRVVKYLRKILPPGCTIDAPSDASEWELVEELDVWDKEGYYPTPRWMFSENEEEGDAEEMIRVFRDRDRAWKRVGELFEGASGAVVEEEEEDDDEDDEESQQEEEYLECFWNGPGDSEIEWGDQESVAQGTESDRED